MRTLRLLVKTVILATLGCSSLCCADEDALKLWYKRPAGAWTEALPVGNGRLAAMVFGDARKERIQLNEDTVWSGEKRDRSNPQAQKAVPEIRRLLQEGHPAQAQALADKAMISIPRALPVYQTLGDLWLDFGDVPEPANYRRELDLDTGVASVRYTVGGVAYLREVFASAPGKAIVVRLTADKPGSISFRATMSRPADATSETGPGRLILTGQALPKRAPGENNAGVRFRAEMRAVTSGGRIENAAGRVERRRCRQRHVDDRCRDRLSRDGPRRGLCARPRDFRAIL
jgi:alpha-L-fucosidase 2